jgi:hypothetical protein
MLGKVSIDRILALAVREREGPESRADATDPKLDMASHGRRRKPPRESPLPPRPRLGYAAVSFGGRPAGWEQGLE